MPIRRERVTKNYTSIPNRVVRDPRLKGEHAGLLVWLLGHDPNWKIIIPVIMRKMGWGRDKTYRILKQPSEFGYIQRAQERDSGSGSFGEVSYTVFSNPDDNSEYAATAFEHPLPDSPLPEKSKASKERSIDSQETPPTPSLKSDQAIDVVNENAIQQISKQTTPAFEEFWKAYSPDPYMSRSKTERRWRRLTPEQRQRANCAVAAYLADCITKNRKRLSVVRYLGDKIWEGFSTAENMTTSWTTITPGTPEWAAWRAHFVATQHHRVRLFDTHERDGKTYTVPSRWPPGAV
jgi:hypothetical protein